MFAQKDTSSVGATQYTVGLSQILRLSPGPNSNQVNFKILSGSGTLFIVNPQQSGTSTAPGYTPTNYYPVGATETIAAAGPACFYLAATTAAMTIAVTIGYTAGATTPL